ncbi:MAG: hypothetical protein DCC49_12620 [Acidobacteria bacterium]|nr:MAG: hypothetical protein DCC49_12620 [Acidobacteriota bacterium]
MARRDRKKPTRRERRREARAQSDWPTPVDEGITVYRDEAEEWPDEPSESLERSVAPAPSGLDLPAIPAFAELRGDSLEEYEPDRESEVVSIAEGESPAAKVAEPEETLEVPSVFGSLGASLSDSTGAPDAAATAKLRAVPDPHESSAESTMIPPEPGEPEEYLSVESAAPILEQLPVPESGHESQSLEELAESAGAHWRDRPEDWEAESQAWEEITAEWKRIDEEEASLEEAQLEEAQLEEAQLEGEALDGPDEALDQPVPLSQRETQPLPTVSGEPDSVEAISGEEGKPGEIAQGEAESGELTETATGDSSSSDVEDLPGPPTEAMVLPSDFLESGTVSEDSESIEAVPSPVPPPPVVHEMPKKRGVGRLFKRKAKSEPEPLPTAEQGAEAAEAEAPVAAFGDVVAAEAGGEAAELIEAARGVEAVELIEATQVEAAPIREQPEFPGAGPPTEYEPLPGTPTSADVTLVESAGDEMEPLPGAPAGEETVAEPVPAEAGKKRNAFVAIATGLVFAAVAVGVIIAGPGYFAVLVAVLAIAAQVEFFTAVRHAGFQPAPILSLIGGVAMVWGGATQGAVAVLFGFFATVLATYLWYHFGVIRTSPVANASVTILGAMYLGFLPAIATLVVGAPTPNPAWRALIIFFVAVTIASDVGGYAFGSWFGKHKMASSISPKKSVEGYVGGFLLALVIAAGFGIAGRFLKNSFSYWHLTNALVAGLVVGIAAPLGDLFESMLKRSLEVKDMGSILPGHGGILDRMDSLVISTPAFFGYLYIAALIQS